ncbi:hypothetical protein GCK32_001053 [Trichostrongylus colubriformis]|uniref:Uncharacterized protein n=1 Tax=Trichostrongylus colubriformis TaxID=6319 RepID=A0AAN8IS09_TRICO
MTTRLCSPSTEWVHAHVRERLHMSSELWHFHYHYICIAEKLEVLCSSLNTVVCFHHSVLQKGSKRRKRKE